VYTGTPQADRGICNWRGLGIDNLHLTPRLTDTSRPIHHLSTHRDVVSTRARLSSPLLRLSGLGLGTLLSNV